MNFKKIFAAILFSTFSAQFLSQSSARDIGILPTFFDRGDISEYIKVKENISTRISSCYSSSKKQPNIPTGKGESLILPFLDYLCVIDNDDILLVMEDWVGINKLDDLTKNVEVFRVGDQIHLKGTDPNTQIAPFQKIVNNFIAKYPRVPDHKFIEDPNKINYSFTSGDTVASVQSERATNIYGDYDPNRFKIKKVNNSEQKVFYPPAPYRDLVSAEFSEVNNLTYNPKPGFEKNKFIVDNLGDSKFKISLLGVVGNEPYIDFAWTGPLEPLKKYQGLELLSVCNDAMNEFVQYKHCLLRQNISGNATCDFKDNNNKISGIAGNVICSSIGSFGSKWDSYLKPVDTNLISGIVAAMVIEDPRFEDILK